MSVVNSFEGHKIRKAINQMTTQFSPSSFVTLGKREKLDINLNAKNLFTQTFSQVPMQTIVSSS